MTDNENLDETEGKELSGYAKQRAKYKEELDAKDQVISDLKSQLIANKKLYFKDTLARQWFKWDFDEFADKYADKLELNEMVALYVGNNGAPVQQATVDQIATEQPTAEAPTIWPRSIIWQNPIGEQYKSVQDMSIDELKEYGRQHPEMFQQ